MISEFNGIIHTLEKALSTAPDSMQFARLADAYVSAGRIDDAADLCLKGIQKFPRYATGRFVLAKVYMAQGNNDDAKRELETALEINNRYVLVWKYYGDLLRNMGQNEASEMSYAELVEIDPLDEDSRAMLEALKRTHESENGPGTAAQDEELPDIAELKEPAEGEDVYAEGGEDKFSYILDDIFSEEEEESKSESVDEESEEIADLSGVELPEEAVTDLETEEAPPLSTIEEETRTSEHSLVDEYARELPRPREPKREKEVEEEERIVTPTLGEIYAAQGQFAKAIAVFEILAKKNPENTTYQDKIAFLKRKLEDSHR